MMHIGRHRENQAVEPGSHLESLYKTVPNWRRILAAVRAGRDEFACMLAASGLREQFGITTSSVHGYHEIEVHAFILGIVSGERWAEVQAKSYLTYASHWIDDFFDSPGRVTDAGQLLADRNDIRRALANMGPAGRVGFAMAERVAHPEAVYKSLQRMLYGGLVQRSLDHRERHALVKEYRSVATEFVAPALAALIDELQPEAYWTTNKTVQELLFAAEEQVDFNTAELWNLVYGPALYYQDADEEKVRGELNFDEDEVPRMDEMLKMIRLGAKYLAPRGEDASLALMQLELAARSIPNLPEPIVAEYRSMRTGTSHESVSA